MNNDFFNECQDLANSFGWEFKDLPSGEVQVFKNGSSWGVFDDIDEAIDAQMEHDSEVRMGC